MVGRDTKTDVAVLKVKTDKPLVAASWGDSGKARVGDWVLAIGNPFGLGGSVTAGILSARQRDINSGPYDDFLQTDAAINRGNSGGPMFNMDGEVIGINTAIYSPNGGSIGIGFAIPSNLAKAVVDQLIHEPDHMMHRGWLGVRIQAVTGGIAESLGLDKPQGALVASVNKNGPAETGGIQPGDVILNFDGKPVPDMRHLPRLVAEETVGKTVPVTVWRKRQQTTLQVKLGRLEETEQVAAKEPDKAKPPKEDSSTVTTLGLTLSNITPELKEKFSLGDDKGVVVVDVDKGQPRGRQGDQSRRRRHGSRAGGGQQHEPGYRQDRRREEGRSQIDPAARRAAGRSALRRVAPRPKLRLEGRRSPSNDLVGAVALGVKQGRQIGVVDAPARHRGDRRLGAEGDTEPGGLQHWQVVGAVADGERRRSRHSALRGQCHQRVAFGLAGDDRCLDRSGNPSVGDIEPIGNDPVEPELRGDPVGENGKPARDQGGSHPARPRGRDQCPRSRHQPDTRCGVVEHRSGQALQQRHPIGERAGEVEFAVHRPPGDLGDMGAPPNEIGQLVEHLVFDDCRFEVGDQHALAAAGRPLDQHVDRGAADRLPGSGCGGLPIAAGEDDVAGRARGEPLGRAGNRQRCGKRGNQVGQDACGAGAGDHCHDQAHDAASFAGSDDVPRLLRRKTALPPVILIAGPTASGKSALALELAAAFRGTIINADSLQIYRDLRILTARPDEAALVRAPHRLYGFLDAAERGSVGHWRVLALSEIDAAHTAGRLPIVVGGTGLYLRALQYGLASIPPIPAAICGEAAELHETLGGAAFRELLRALDPVAAARLSTGDRQRLMRAFAVVRATGRPIGEWQLGPAPASPYRFASLLLMPPREALYTTCDARFRAMIATGALDETAALAARGLDPGLPAMKAVGVPELLRHLRGAIDLDDAVALATRATRRYAKRQMTWFRHQMVPDLVLSAQLSGSLLQCSRHFIYDFLLTSPT